ncbi:MAG: fibronectin type III domain-containing protein, partial [Betaproteobacteria bacterium]
TATPIQSAPSAPQNLTAGNTVSNQIDLTWGTPVSNGGASITNYLVEYKLTSEPTVWTTFAHGVSTATSISVTGLTNGLSYDFRVSAINSNGTGTASAIVTKPTVNSTPAAPIASSVSIAGQPHVSEYLLGSYVYSDPNADPEGVTTFRWVSSSTLGGTYSPISGATSINYTVGSGDLNNYLKLEVTPVATIAPFTGTPVLSNAIGPITAANYIYHILSTGQSLSLGYAGSPVLSTTQPYSNKMLDGTDSAPGTNLSPLVEVSNETPAAAMGNGITFQNGVQTVVTRHGVGGTAYSGLKKGTAPYANGMQQFVNVRNAATLLGETSQVMGVTTVHGETDSISGTSAATYEADLAEWQHDYETDIKAINGQTGTIPMFTDQMDSYTTYGNATSVIPQAQLAASEDYPGKIILVGPKYFLNYSGTGPHLTNTSYRMLGEYYAKVMKKVFFDKVAWRPLSPDAIQLIGNVIYAKFHVPAGVLALDTNIVSQNTNYGFEYYDTTSSATISSVSIMNSDTVKITLSNVPTGGNQRLRYAYTGVINAAAGAQSAGAPRGNLRDTDSTVSLSGNNLYDWAVHFDKSITTVSDTTAPTVTSFSIPSNSSSYTVPINSFTASDDYIVTGYLLTESSSAPLASDS